MSQEEQNNTEEPDISDEEKKDIEERVKRIFAMYVKTQEQIPYLKTIDENLATELKDVMNGTLPVISRVKRINELMTALNVKYEEKRKANAN